MPPGPPLEPRGPLGGPRLRECISGGPRLPALSNWGFVACSTLIGLPSRDFPFISRAASFASAGLSKVTKAKPLDLLVSRSFIKITSTILPYLLKYCSRAFSVVSVFSPPMKSFPGRSASAMLSDATPCSCAVEKRKMAINVPAVFASYFANTS